MRVSRTQASENRQAVIEVASRLFREHGFDGIGLKSLMEAAGLTQGAFYKQFASKEDLIAQASTRALESATQQWAAAAAANPMDSLGGVVAFYLSPEHQDEKLDGCPVVALGSDAARQSAAVKASFETGIKTYLGILERMISQNGNDNLEGKALAILSIMVGSMTLARAVNDQALAQSVFNSGIEQVRKIAAS